MNTIHNLNKVDDSYYFELRNGINSRTKAKNTHKLFVKLNHRFNKNGI